MNTPYEPPKAPKTITKVSDDQYLDFGKPFTWVLMSFVSVAIVLIYEIEIVEGTVFKIILGTALIILIAFWLKYFSSSEKVDKQFNTVRFFFADKKGDHVINMFTVSASFLEKIVPIKDIHEGGIIEFTDSKFGVLMETFPIRISDEDREDHEKKIQKVVNGIPANTHFKTIACSRLQPRKPIEQHLLEVANNSTGKKPTDLHLTGLYTKGAEDNSPVISWKYYAFQSLGKQPSLEAARIQYGAVIPGLLKNMNAAKLQPRVYTDPEEITAAYRTLFSELII